MGTGDEGAAGGEPAASAGEYVLGVLGAEERRAFERRLAGDPRLQEAVAFWQERLAPLGVATPAEDPPPRVWRAIERSLDGRSRRVARHRSGGRRRAAATWLWRAWAFGSTAVAAGLAGWIVLAGLGQRQVTLVALLNDQSAATGPGFVLRAEPERLTLAAQPVRAAAVDSAGTVPELWLVPGGEAAPLSLGLLDPAQAVTRDLPAAFSDRMVAGATVAVSLEPPGGSPTGAPTGPVVYTGTLISLPPAPSDLLRGRF